MIGVETCDNCGADESHNISWLDVWGNQHHDGLCVECMLAWYDELKEDWATLTGDGFDNAVNIRLGIWKVYYDLLLDAVVTGE